MFSRNLKRSRIIDDVNAEIAVLGLPSFSSSVMFEKANIDDLERYTPLMLALTSIVSHDILMDWDSSPSAECIDIREVEGINPSGASISIVTVVVDNLPFLYQSVIGEIVASHRNIMMAIHPVLVKDKNSEWNLYSPEIHDISQRQISLIQVHIPKISPAEAEDIKKQLIFIIDQLKLIAQDSQAMHSSIDEIQNSLSHFTNVSNKNKGEDIVEALTFLDWLKEDNFKFMGMRYYSQEVEQEKIELNHDVASGLGILKNPDLLILSFYREDKLVEPEVRDFLEGPDFLIVTKSNVMSVVYRRAYMDFIGIKHFDGKGKLIGELHVVGFFTHLAYSQRATKIPLLREKIIKVQNLLNFYPDSHSDRMLQNMLEGYPRDELFQIDPMLLASFCEQIIDIIDRPRTRVLPRIDRFNRFVSLLIYIPREYFDSSVREKIGNYLSEVYVGHVSAFYSSFLEEGLVRIHFVIGRSGGETPNPSQEYLEERVRSIVAYWEEKFYKSAGDGIPRFVFSQTFQDVFSPEKAVEYLHYITNCAEGKEKLCVDFSSKEDGGIQIKIFHANDPFSLSKRVPLLENLGFTVISEDTFEIKMIADDGEHLVVLYQMDLKPANAVQFDLANRRDALVEAFKYIFQDRVDNDSFNHLIMLTDLRVYEISVLRSYARYLRQTSVIWSQDFIAQILSKNPSISQLLFSLFHSRFDPNLSDKERDKSIKRILKEIDSSLLKVSSLDDDTVLRCYVNLIVGTLRTNYFQKHPYDLALVFKFDSSQIKSLGAEELHREIFVYCVEVEGVHLRCGKIARGGLRWSDRAEDYRTEVLGLVRAQKVKNAVIVPVGAKGGFYPKRLPSEGPRDEIIKIGRKAYKTYVRALLSVTDNFEGQKIIHPANTVCLDGDDPYFVVAADKGTATFSDTANSLSQEAKFWLDDAFASGGSKGYDHKKMAITARGAWETVKRHFREMDIDIQTMPFTVAGVGDMSGDVFGNGMLLSRQIKLVAAFDRSDIFIDPDPDLETTFNERKRLFNAPSSSWQDFDRKVLSKGGMIISRREKSVRLTPEAAAVIGVSKAISTSSEIVSAILMAPVDLLWFGGIGTYISSSQDSDADIGDKANNIVRVTADNVQAKVIGEGANLGLTQRARIVYSLSGGRINSDAIDNSAGVNCSDLEVNIKIALASAMRDGRLTLEDRNKLLRSMTSEVIALVLRNNYLQSLAISLEVRKGMAMMWNFAQLMKFLEKEGSLDRKIEHLPSIAAFEERISADIPLSRPEVGILLSYAKLKLSEKLLEGTLIDDPWFTNLLLNYFPEKLSQLYSEDIMNHQLRRAIIATVLANGIINKGGSCFVVSLSKETSSSIENVVRSAVIAYAGYELDYLWKEVDRLDNQISGELQNKIYEEIRLIFISLTRLLIKNGTFIGDIGNAVKRLLTAFHKLDALLQEKIPEEWSERFNKRVMNLISNGFPPDIANKIVRMQFLMVVPDLIDISETCNTSLLVVLDMWSAISAGLGVDRLLSVANNVVVDDHYENLALSAGLDWMYSARREMIAKAITAGSSVATIMQNEKWQEVKDQVFDILSTEEEEVTVAQITVATHLLSGFLLKI
ncbi:NAD-glutamate dehydrogenase [Candidatus Liberibacter solanacearum]|uniref:NAD-glutamate dehydrogenase n=1 Tax=Candidatus Liberibacter solanacearum TaxID=556287 RepID=A0A424FN40_9HYPH|nr:NAD-glutamate dehydrogenase domain-containing protein [Candidatus Liberibacter solanacearum]RPD37537.1 NAD-glutamate dehydrogenase [Candidatus Liberibacter solanacearum]